MGRLRHRGVTWMPPRPASPCPWPRAHRGREHAHTGPRPGALAHRRGLPVLLLLFVIFIARLPLGQLAGGQAPPLQQRHNTHSEGPGGSWHGHRPPVRSGLVRFPPPDPTPTIASRERADAVTARARRWREKRRAGPAPRPQGWPSERRAAPGPIDPLGAPRREGTAKKCNPLLIYIYIVFICIYTAYLRFMMNLCVK